MSSNMNEHQIFDSPYSSKEVSRAKAIIKEEMKMGSLRYLNLNRYSAESSSFPNLWEGDNGLMEHVKDKFPMPLVDTSGDVDPDEKSELPKSRRPNVNRSSTDGCSSSSVEKGNYSGSLENKKDEDVNGGNNSNSNKIIFSGSASDDSDSEEEDCVILEGVELEEEEKEVIEIEDDDNNDNDNSEDESTHSSSVLSPAEMKHQKNLDVLKKDIRATKTRLGAIKSLFKFEKNVSKAGDGMTLLHEELHVLTNKLMTGKDEIDIYKTSQKDKSGKHTAVCESIIASYQKVWLSLRRLCQQFGRVRKNKKDVLNKLDKFQELSPMDFQKIISQIKYAVKKKR